MPFWTALTCAGLTAGLVAGLLGGSLLEGVVNAMITTAFVTCCAGAVLGAFQSVGLRRLPVNRLLWIAATTIGVGAGLAAGVVVVEQIGIAATGTRPNIARLGVGMRTLSFVAIGIITGTALGFAQALAMGGKRAGLWTIATAGGLTIAFAAASMFLSVTGLPIGSLPGVAAFVLVSGALFGLLTSGALRRAAGG
jgi:hypothetical protein